MAEEVAEEAEEEWRFLEKNNKNPFEECIFLNGLLSTCPEDRNPFGRTTFDAYPRNNHCLVHGIM